MRYPLLIAIICFFSRASLAQDYSYVHYDTRDGLAGSVVYRIVQDKDGFMWFATETGLSRFDGTHFKTFTNADGLPDNEILNLFADSKGRVWVVPFKNSVCYYFRGKFYTKENDPLLKQLQFASEIVSIKENALGEIAICDHADIYIISHDDSVKKINYSCVGPCGLMGGGLGQNNSFVFTKGVYINNDNVLQCAQLKDGDLVPVYSWVGFHPNFINSVFLSKNVCAIRKRERLYFFVQGAAAPFFIPFPEGFLNMDLFNDSCIVISSAAVVQVYNFYQRKTTATFFTGKNISSVIEDKEGNIWFSSLGEGAYKLTSAEFKSFSFKAGNSVLPVTALKKYGDTVYIGTSQFRLWNLNTKTGRQKFIKVHKGATESRIVTIDRRYNGNLLLGSDEGMFEVTSRGPVKQDASKQDAIKAYCKAGDTLLLGTSSHLIQFYTKKLLIPDVWWAKRITALCALNRTVFIGTLNGLYKGDLRDRKIQYLGNTDVALSKRITSLCTDPAGKIWIATHGNGVVGYSDGKVTDTLNIQKGLSSNICRTLFVDKTTLWVGSDKGLSKVDLATSPCTITNYTMSDGLMNNIINCIYTDGKNVYAGTPSGLNYFDESRINTRSICVLRVTGFQSNKRQWSCDTTGVQFDHQDNTIRFEYSGISFKSGNEIIYRYRLLGLGEEWLTTSQNTLQFPELSSGNYELQLMATNKFGVRSNLVSIPFNIKKLFWEKNWFRLLVLLFIGVLIWIIVTQRIRNIRRQETDKSNTNKKIAELEQMALKAQMNPHFIFNSLNSIQQYVIDKDVRGANKFITAFSRLVRLTLELSSKPWISLVEEINYISTYLELEKERFESTFNYQVQWEEGIDLSNNYIPPMILQPYVENSIRHGVRYRNDNKGFIAINFTMTKGFLLCIIEDNGVGRCASQQFKGKENIEYQSKGMTLTAKRIAMMNNNSAIPISHEVVDLFDKIGEPVGTKIVIQFPFRNSGNN